MSRFSVTGLLDYFSLAGCTLQSTHRWYARYTVYILHRNDVTYASGSDAPILQSPIYNAAASHSCSEPQQSLICRSYYPPAWFIITQPWGQNSNLHNFPKEATFMGILLINILPISLPSWPGVCTCARRSKQGGLESSEEMFRTRRRRSTGFRRGLVAAAVV